MTAATHAADGSEHVGMAGKTAIRQRFMWPRSCRRSSGLLGRGAVLLSGTTADLTAAHGGQGPEQVILSALRENAQGQAQEVVQ